MTNHLFHKPVILLISCEHGGNKIPKAHRSLFANAEKVLNSHRGWDLGALDIARHLAGKEHPFIYSQTSRLYVELNRSLHHPQLFSPYTKELSTPEKFDILNQYYHPYRQEVVDLITHKVCSNYVILHLSVHTFTPVLVDVERKADIGLLYNPNRSLERTFCKHWKKHLTDCNLLTRCNYPYRGIADGFTTYLRKQFNRDQYLGIEIEINQKFFPIEFKLKKQIKLALNLALNKY